MIVRGMIVHGGAGTPVGFSDGCRAVCDSAFGLLKAGRSALDAATEAARILEDDGRFNAGWGSALRLDGKTVEMDAAVMDSRGRIGVVIAIRNVKNPALVARAVMETPHVALSGEGATAFARRRGFAPGKGASPWALERYERLRRLVKEGKAAEMNPAWRGQDLEQLWNFEETSYKEFFATDTIGAVALDREGTLAVAASTGGASPMMRGRVGDTPMIGCGFYAGPDGAVACTGIGEEIVRKMLAKTVYDIISGGEEVRAACEKGLSLFPPDIAVGIIALSPAGYAAVSNTTMSHHVMVEEAPHPPLRK